MNTKTTTVDPKSFYLKTEDGSYILPASLTKRFFARILDFLIYFSIGWILITISSTQAFNNFSNASIFPGGPGTTAKAFFELTNKPYELLYMMGVSLIIISSIFFGLIYPIFLNKKNPGQSLGKKALGITPMFLSEKYNHARDILKREIPLVLFFIFSNIILLTIGFNYSTTSAMYNQYQSVISNVNDSGLIYTSIFNFIKLSADSSILNANNFQISMGYLSISLSMIFWILMIALTFSIAFGNKKRGFHDSFANTAIVDLSTMGKFSDLEENISETDILPTSHEEQKFEFSKLTINNFDFEEVKLGSDLQNNLENNKNNLGQDQDEITLIDYENNHDNDKSKNPIPNIIDDKENLSK